MCMPMTPISEGGRHFRPDDQVPPVPVAGAENQNFGIIAGWARRGRRGRKEGKTRRWGEHGAVLWTMLGRGLNSRDQAMRWGGQPTSM